MDMLRQKLSKRGIDVACLKEEEPEISGTEARQKVIMRQGIDTPLASERASLTPCRSERASEFIWTKYGSSVCCVWAKGVVVFRHRPTIQPRA